MDGFTVPECEVEFKRGKFSRKKRSIFPPTAYRVFHECGFQCVICGLCTTPDIPRDVHGRPIAFRRLEDGSLEPTNHRLTIDHLVPKSLGSANHYPNLLLLCSFCNNKKADMLPRVWLKTLSVELQVRLLDKVIEAETYHILVSEG